VDWAAMRFPLNSDQIKANAQETREIAEAYDEALHGPLDGPMVPSSVVAQRQRLGHPRNAAEAVTTSFAPGFTAKGEFEEDDSSAWSCPAPKGPDNSLADACDACGHNPVSDSSDPFSGAPDSDDEDDGQAKSPAASRIDHFQADAPQTNSASQQADELSMLNTEALEAELGRLEDAFERDFDFSSGNERHHGRSDPYSFVENSCRVSLTPSPTFLGPCTCFDSSIVTIHRSAYRKQQVAFMCQCVEDC
jgi:hypothetical protein